MNKTSIILIASILSAALCGAIIYEAYKAWKINNLPPTPVKSNTDGYYIVNMLSQSSLFNLNIQLEWVAGQNFVNDPSNPVIERLSFKINFDNYNELSIKITDIDDTRFTLPYKEPFPYTKVTYEPSKESLFDYIISVPGEAFYFKLWRKDTGEVLFDTTNTPLIFQDKYLQITNKLNKSALFGLGERRTTFKLKSGQYSIWAADAARIDYGHPGEQIYGTHPMYLKRDDATKNFHVLFLRNAYGMEIDYQENESITYKVIGGNFDFKFFLGNNNPEEPIKLYHNYINGWILHPFWVQGFHQCRWGYKTSEELMQVWDKFNELSIPIDSLWSDIDYMYEFYDFTIDLSRFNISQMKQIYDLKDPKGVHWSSIIDVGIAIGSDAAVRGQELNTFIKSGYTGQDLIGNVWPGNTYYPDFNHPNSTQFWFEGLNNITKNYGLVQEGIWIDMNEFSNFVNGEVLPSVKDSKFLSNQTLKSEKSSLQLPFNPQGDTDLEFKTLSLNAKHYNEKDGLMLHIPNYNLTQYDMHNLNGFGESIATYEAAKLMGRNLTFILSRSTLFGSGKYVQHWNGDGFSQWDYLFYTIPGIINFQMYGIPFVGDDICGLNGNATPELCARWMQLGSLYPFSRNHNGNESISQEPYAFPDYHYVLSSSIKTLNVRYQLLKFYYHLFVKEQGSGTIFRPLMWSFPNDDEALNYEAEFMLGDYLLAAPVVAQGNEVTNTTGLDFYIPQGGVFYDFYNQQRYTEGKYHQDVPFDSVVPLFVKAGKIVHIQDQKPVLRSRFLDNHFTLYIALDSNLYASGSILTINDYNNDENIIRNCLEGANCVTIIEAQGKFENNSFSISLKNTQEQKNTQFQEVVIDKVIIAGISTFGNYISKIVDISSNPFIINKDKQQYDININLQ
ncbi:glycosyl hydrolase family 31 protein (macronuclear) [Tetrahymena thermophila SB210]|uniref:Maltase n=2 Tax=Tetrahymena TaxID=5890 RepID=I7MFP1_TETTS|nr:glycosyl hydrolase family 31 protein [Tetrahymena thermophila SB210]EAS00396.2 glycosyl hydrolase family 31 protein [Tetrahymena thermophila SB210]|eukprot:XP_001020641.2 glycosyl hydrolase family 31 protein [Tetrahymena thermophila SB210]